jgi:hypothetical protein
MSMNLRHAAAFALVGWYLMTPPPPFNPSTPLSKWTREGKTDYASEEECTAVREKLQTTFRDPGNIPPEHVTATIMVKAMAHLLCIASDDPRLKEK